MNRKITGLALFGMIMMAQPGYAAFGGFRVGLDLGLQMLQGRHTYTGPGSPLSDQRVRLSANSYTLGARAGYLFEIPSEKLVLGLEAYFLLPGAKPTYPVELVPPTETDDFGVTTHSRSGQVHIKHTNSIGVAGTIGMMLNPKVMVYLNLGLEMAKFTLRYNITHVKTTIGLFDSVTTTTNQQNVSHTFAGFTPGIGADYKVSPHFLIGALISNPFWKSFKVTSTAPRPRKGYNYKFKPVERRFFIRFTYLL